MSAIFRRRLSMAFLCAIVGATDAHSGPLVTGKVVCNRASSVEGIVVFHSLCPASAVVTDETGHFELSLPSVFYGQRLRLYFIGARGDTIGTKELAEPMSSRTAIHAIELEANVCGSGDSDAVSATLYDLQQKGCIRPGPLSFLASFAETLRDGGLLQRVALDLLPGGETPADTLRGAVTEILERRSGTFCFLRPQCCRQKTRIFIRARRWLQPSRGKSIGAPAGALSRVEMGFARLLHQRRLRRSRFGERRVQRQLPASRRRRRLRRQRQLSSRQSSGTSLHPADVR